jgi:hypothetical protein
MASQQHDTVFPDEDIDDEDEEFHEYEEEDEEEDDVLVEDEETNPSASISAPSVTVAVPGSVISNGETRPPILTPTATTIVFAMNANVWIKLKRKNLWKIHVSFFNVYGPTKTRWSCYKVFSITQRREVLLITTTPLNSTIKSNRNSNSISTRTSS